MHGGGRGADRRVNPKEDTQWPVYCTYNGSTYSWVS